MSHRKALHSFGLLAAAFVAVPAVWAQQPVVGGTLVVASPGPVTVELLADTTPASLDWYLPLSWKTGPRILDYSSSDGHVYSCKVGGNISCGYTAADFSGRVGKALAHPAPSGEPGWSNNAPGTRISSPALTAGTTVFLAASTYSEFDPAYGWTQRHLVRTGGAPGELLNELSPRNAVVFAGPGNTVRIGFTDSGSEPSANFLDYPIRIQVSNVRLGG